MESGSLTWETSRSIGELLEQHQLLHLLELPFCRNLVEVNPTRNRHSAIIHTVPANLIATRILRLRSDQRPNHLTQHIVNLERYVGGLGQIVLNGRIRVKWIGEVLVQSELSGRALEFQHTRDHRRVGEDDVGSKTRPLAISNLALSSNSYNTRKTNRTMSPPPETAVPLIHTIDNFNLTVGKHVMEQHCLSTC